MARGLLKLNAATNGFRSNKLCHRFGNTFLAVLQQSRYMNRDLKIYNVNMNDVSFETKQFFMQNKENG